ncbi:MAG: hypothetical protein HY075_10520, partial [Deltaproteobacteria bacterium]|nr:hypothetical protein [Deltaproteobacteria bacterium]
MPPIRFDPESGNVVVTGTALAAYRRARSATGALWSRTREFAGFEGDATYLVPRWVFLRMVALIHLLNFVDLIRFGTGMIGEKGVYPVAGLLPNMRLTDLFLR